MWQQNSKYSSAEILLHTNTFVQKTFFTHRYFLQRGIFARILSRRGAFTHRCFETRTRLGKRLEAQFGEGSSNFGIRFPSIMFLQRDAFTYKCFYTGRGLHRDGFTQRDDFTKGCFYLQALLHRDTFNTEMLLHTGALRHKCFFHRDDFAERNF